MRIDEDREPYTDEQRAKVGQLWQQLMDCNQTRLVEDRGYVWPIAQLQDGQLDALIASDGAETDDFYPVTVVLADYSDQHGSDLDAANVEALRDTPGVTVWTNGVHGEGSATAQLGELPYNGDGDTVDTGIEWLAALVAMIQRLDECCLIDDETHSEYIEGLAEEAWSAYLWPDIKSELWELLPDEVDYEAREDALRLEYFEFEGNDWYAETATSVVNGRHDDAVRHAVRAVLNVDLGELQR